MNAPEKLQVATRDLFVSVPQTTLPGGRVVPAFEVGQYLTSQGTDGKASITAEGTPRVRINYSEARQAAEAAGYKLITESQALALAYQIALQGENWTGGKIGAGMLRQGLRKGSVRSAQPGTYEPNDQDERRGFALPNGQTIFDAAGNAYSWVFDDVQGNENGIVAQPFAKDSPSIVIPYPNENKGQGWTPAAGSNWSGYALIRGGCWYSGSYAGAFSLNGVWPDDRYAYVGFRCTK